MLDFNAAAAHAAKVAVVVKGGFTGGSIMTDYNGTSTKRSQGACGQILGMGLRLKMEGHS